MLTGPPQVRREKCKQSWKRTLRKFTPVVEQLCNLPFFKKQTIKQTSFSYFLPFVSGKPNPQFQSCWTIDIHAGIGSSVSSVNSIWLAEYYQTLAVISSSRESAQVKSTRMTNNRGVVTKRRTKDGWRKMVSAVQNSIKYSTRIESTNTCISLILGEICTTFLGERARIELTTRRNENSRSQRNITRPKQNLSSILTPHGCRTGCPCRGVCTEYSPVFGRIVAGNGNLCVWVIFLEHGCHLALSLSSDLRTTKTTFVGLQKLPNRRRDGFPWFPTLAPELQWA